MTTARYREREKKKLRQKEEEAITHYLQIIQFFRQRVKNSEINRLRKQKQNNQRTIMISAKKTTKLHDKKKERKNSTCLA